MRNNERTRRRSETGRRFASASTVPLQDCEWSTALPEPLQPDWPESMSLLVQTLQPKRRPEQHREASKAKFLELPPPRWRGAKPRTPHMTSDSPDSSLEEEP